MRRHHFFRCRILRGCIRAPGSRGRGLCCEDDGCPIPGTQTWSGDTKSSLIHAHPHMDTLTHTFTYTRTHTHTHARTLSHTDSHTHTLSLSHTHTLSLSHTLTHSGLSLILRIATEIETHQFPRPTCRYHDNLRGNVPMHESHSGV